MSFLVAAISITSSAYATSANFTIYNSNSQNSGIVKAFSTIGTTNQQIVGVTATSTLSYDSLQVDLSSAEVYISAFKNGSFYGDISGTKVASNGAQANASLTMGTFDGVQSHYTAATTHYTYRKDGIKTGYGTLNPTWIN
ncbi:hypothetical protein ACFQZT_30800 [Paenibacillus sp. GCM10027628]|uniref:hypothetical protein n=1 Tax=Paenibacillus sp. GCM10027628 TaxID=3273413 RepID=UPI003629F82A